MAGDALARANDSLKSGGEVTIDTARRMGLFVVSRLAEEHGLKVKLRRNTNGGGIIASIMLPTGVLVGDGPVEHVSLLDAPEQVEEPEVRSSTRSRRRSTTPTSSASRRRSPPSRVCLGAGPALSAGPEPAATRPAPVGMFEAPPSPSCRRLRADRAAQPVRRVRPASASAEPDRLRSACTTTAADG